MKSLFAALLVVTSCAAFADDCCKAKQPSAEETFMKIAKEMEMKAEGKMACCKTTATVAVVKGEEGCCNAPGEPKLFKVFVANSGYKFYGCKDSAAKGRQELVASGMKVGKVQKTVKA